MKAEFIAALITELEVFLKVKGGSMKDFAFWLLERQELKDSANLNEGDLQLKIVELSRALEIQAKSSTTSSSQQPSDVIQVIRLLSLVDNLENPIKKDIVQSSLMEQSTGFYALKELVNTSYLQEKQNRDDKRKKFLALTPKGKKFLKEKKEDLNKISITDALNTQADKKSFAKMISVIHRHHLNRMETKK